jgi:hypothetical protein
MRAATPKERTLARVQCAADYGDQQSLARHASGGAPPNFAENLLGGNTASELTNIGLDVFGNRTPSGSEVATAFLSGGRQGIPGGGAGSKGVIGVAQDTSLEAMGGSAAVEAGTVVGVLKFGYDLGTTLYGLKVCSE